MSVDTFNVLVNIADYALFSIGFGFGSIFWLLFLTKVFNR